MQACINFTSLPSRDACLAAFTSPDAATSAYVIGVAILALAAKFAVAIIFD